MTTPTLVGTVTTATSSSTSFTCNKPSGVALDDLMLSFQFTDNGIGTITSGWSSLQAISDTGFDSRVGMKVAGGSEGATYTFAQNASAAGGAIILALRDTASGTPVSAQANNVGSGTVCTTPSVVALGADDFEVRFIMAINTTSFTAPGGFTPRANISPSAGIAGACATRVLSSSGATGTADFTANASVPDRYGYTITVSGKPGGGGRRLLTATSVAVHRGTW